MADIILSTINAKWIHPSLALRLLKANLQELEEKCEILEFALRQPLSEKTEAILAGRPRVLGLSVSIWNHKATCELLKALGDKWYGLCTEASINNNKPNKPIIVLGGPEVSWLPEEAEIFSHADYVIRGEGEESFPALCREILSGAAGEVESEEAGDIDPGVLARGSQAQGQGSAVFINQGTSVVDLNKIDPAYHFYTDEDLQKKHIYVEASRGCPFGCEYCQGSLGDQVGIQGPREFPLEPFLEDMAKLIDRGGRTFKFLDRSFNLNIGRAIKIMEFYLGRRAADDVHRRAAKDRPLCVHFEMVPYRLPDELKEVLCRFPRGSLRLELGIQTLNPETAALIRRTGETEEALKNLRFLRAKTNAILHVDLIAGLPGEDLASFGAGFDRLWEVLAANSSPPGEGASEKPWEIQVGILKGLPGTPILRHNKSYGMLYSGEPPYEIMETGVLSAPELGRIKNFARFWELIVNRNPFPDLRARLLIPGEAAFDKFMNLSDKLREHFGRDWGLDRKELRLFLEELIQ